MQNEITVFMKSLFYHDILRLNPDEGKTITKQN